MNIILEPWPWYLAGPLVGLLVASLLIFDNNSFGISNSFRHICAAVIPSKIEFFNYDWKKESWQIFLVSGALIGGFIAAFYLSNAQSVDISEATKADLAQLGITDFSGLLPKQIFSTEYILSWKGIIFMVIGGFLIGFGTRYGGGCTSGHAIMGLSTLQLPSLVATITFFTSGALTANFLLPYILKWILK